MNTRFEFSKTFYILLAYFIYALFTYGWFSANLVMPILPELTQVFHASGTLVKLSVTAFLFGFAAFQLMWGPLSDRIGRIKVLMIGFSITVLGALAAAFAPSITVFIVARFVEAIGMACGPVMARSMMMDAFSSEKITKVVANSAIVVAVMPAIGPILGGWLALLLTWHAVLLFLVLYGVVMIIITVTGLQETHRERSQHVASFKRLLKTYWQCLLNKQFLGAIIVYALFFGGILGFYTDAPFIFINGLGYSKTTYGWFMFVPVLTYITGAALAKAIIQRTSARLSIIVGIVIGGIGSLLLIIFSLFLAVSPFTVLLPIGIFILGSGIMSPSANTLAMTAFSSNKGSAAALIGCAMALGSAIFSAVVALLHSQTLIPLILITTSIVVVGTLVYGLVLRR